MSNAIPQDETRRKYIYVNLFTKFITLALVSISYLEYLSQNGSDSLLRHCTVNDLTPRPAATSASDQ